MEETKKTSEFNDDFDPAPENVPDEGALQWTPFHSDEEEYKKAEERDLIYRDEDGFVYDLTETMTEISRDKEKVRRYEIKDKPEEFKEDEPGWSDIDADEPLTHKQELFCQYYIVNKATRFNATRSYAMAYGYDLDAADTTVIFDRVTGKEIKKSERKRMENVCGVCWDINLRKPKIQKRNRALMAEMMNDEIVDEKMLEHILWDDPQASRDMIKEYNKLRQRIIEKHEHKLKFDLSKASEKELNEGIKDLM